MLVECVPNFSEGTDQALIDEIVEAVKTARVLDVHSDPDHNRSVVTMIGSPAEVRQAAFDLTERAMQLLDVTEHQGAHPFIGVVDVIPFIPLKDISKKELVGLAEELGKELWQKLKLPVFFYGEAARRPERKELPNVRRGGYANLRREIDLPERRPDVGQGLHPTAGAVAVGVRNILIAFNVNLDTRELNIAKSIASNIREKNGGLPGIRALGIELESRGITQVTINVVNYQQTSLKKLFDQIKKLAKEYRVEIINSELVGLIPQEAVFPNMKEYLKLSAFSKRQVLV